MCGFIGIAGTDEASARIAEALLVLQHRGQDAAGIASYDGTQFHIERGSGLVREIFSSAMVAGMRGAFAIGHTRYPTVGGGTAADAQPLYTNTPHGIAMAHNGNVTNFPQLERNLLKQDSRRLQTTCDVELILNVFAAELLRAPSDDAWAEQVRFAMDRVFTRVRGTYSAAALVGDRGMVAFRDPWGIKPAVLGKREEADGSTSWCVTSESAALKVLGYERDRDLEAGEVLIFHPDGTQARFVLDSVPHAVHRPCVFEFIYFARPDSVIDTISVYKARLRLGAELARHIEAKGLDPEVVVPVPDSARPAALECARTLGVVYREGLLKNRYVGRTFIMPGQENRAKNVMAKLTPLPMEMEGKRVLLIDDSVVRGTTTRAVVDMVRKAGATKVYVGVASPKIKHPCVYGIDMQTKEQFIARKEATDEGIAKAIGADAIVYLPVDAMSQAVKGPMDGAIEFCRACMDGAYPTGDVTEEVLANIESERSRASRCGG